MSFYRQSANIPINGATNILANIVGVPQGLWPININYGKVFSIINNGFASNLNFNIVANPIIGGTITIVGTYNGNIITENLAGAGAGGVLTTINLYDTIISISCNVAFPAANVLVYYCNMVAVRLNNYNFQNNITKSNLNFNFFISNLTAAGPPGIELFGVTTTQPQALRVANFAVATRPANFQLLTPAITQAQANAGYNFTVTYQYAMVIVYLVNVATPTYVEITQA